MNLVTHNSLTPASPVRQTSRPALRRSDNGQGLTHALTLVLPREAGRRASDPFFDRFVAGITGQATANGFTLSIAYEKNSTDERSPYLQQIERRSADGFFVVRPAAQDERITLLQAHGVPFVVYGRTLDGNNFPHVDIDSERGMRKMVDHLTGIGHTRIGGIFASTDLAESIQRRCALEATLQDRGLLDPDLIVGSRCTRQASYNAARQLLGCSERPTAIVCGGDLMAVGACAAVADEGLTVGKDVSIGGFDDVFGDNIHPGLTTIRNPVTAIGRMLCQMLVQIVAGRELRRSQIVLEPDLIIRRSTAPLTR